MGDNFGCSKYSELQESGELGGIDYFLAAKVHDDQCENGESYSCFRIGKFYHSYNLGEPNFDKARKYFNKGCELGNASSCIELILEMEVNRSDTEGVDEASTFAGASCEKGGRYVCSGIGWAIANKKLAGGPDRAITFFMKAMRNGSPAPFDIFTPADGAVSEEYVIFDRQHWELTKSLQNALRREGVLSGSADGIPGPETQQAVRALCECRLSLDV